MARTFKKADELKNKILHTAGQCFKEYGYNKTTFQMIADELGIAKSTISYHFKSKSRIRLSLFQKYIAALRSFVRENKDKSFNAYKIHCVTHIYFYRKVLSSPKNRELFYYCPDKDKKWTSEQISYAKACIREVANDFKKDFTDEELNMAALMSVGAKAIMFKEFSENSKRISEDAHCYHTAYIMGLISRLDEATIVKNLQSAFEFANRHAPPCMDFLD